MAPNAWSSMIDNFRVTSSKRNINLWIVPLKMPLAAKVLFAVTITPDTPAVGLHSNPGTLLFGLTYCT
jgi:hypothetical protein